METPPDPDAIARAFIEEELAKDRPKPTGTTPEIAPTAPSVAATSEPLLSQISPQDEVDAYIASLDAQVTDENLLTPFTKLNKRRSEELSRPFDLSKEGSQSASPTASAAPMMPDPKRAAETKSPEADASSPIEDQVFKFVFSRLGKDKSVHYQASDGSIYEITKKPGGYRITKSGDPAIASISRTEIMKRGQAEQWVVVETKQPDVAAESAAADSPASPPSDSEPAAADAGTTGPKSAPEAGPPREPVMESPASLETIPLVEMDGVHIPENEITVADIDSQIIKLREEVASERAAFIAVEESQRSAWRNLTRIFRGLSHKDSDDAELIKYRAFYDEKVLALQNAELEKLKRSGKTVKELRPEMAALIREFEFDEAERIYAARQEMRLAKTNQPLLEKMRTLWTEAEEGINGPTAKGEVKAWIKLFAGGTIIAGEGALRTLETVGKFSNKISRGKAGKYVLTATITVGGAVALGVATGGTASVAMGALVLKRLTAGAGLAVAAEAGMNQYAKYRREKKRDSVETDHEARFDLMESEEDLEIKLGNKQEIDFSKLEKYLKEVSAETRKGEGARRRNELFRKSGAIFAGVVLGSGAAAHFANEYIGAGSKAHAAALSGSEANISPGDPGVGPSTAESSTVSEPLKDTQSIPAPSGEEMNEGLKAARATPAPAEVSRASAKELLAPYEVKRGESIWKLVTRSVEDVPGMNERATGRFAKLVEFRLAEKLEASPELARSAGFVADADGKFRPDYIRAGAKLELGKLLSQDELAKLLEEARGEGPISAPSVAIPETPIRETVPSIPNPTPVLSEAELAAREEARIARQIPSISAEERATIAATFAENPTAELTSPDGNVMKYIEGLPQVDQEKLFHDFKKISVELFQTNEVMGGEVYEMRYDPAVHPELAKTKLVAVLTDHKLLTKNPLIGYDRLKNPLHWSQMEEVAKLAKASAKTFGESVAQPKTTESVQEYALRMIAIARNQGVKIPGFRMLD